MASYPHLTDGHRIEMRECRIGAVRVHDFVVPDGEPGSDINRERLEVIDALNHTRLNGDRIARLTFHVLAAHDRLHTYGTVMRVS